jgi:hypothetical protein
MDNLNIAVPQEKLLQLFNNMWRNHKTPTYLETGTVIIIHKARRKIIVMITYYRRHRPNPRYKQIN